MVLHHQILQKIFRAIKTPHLQRRQALPSNTIVQVLLTPLRHHKQICSMHTVVDPIRAGTRGIVVGADSPVLTSPRLRPIHYIAEVFPVGLALAIIANRAMNVVLCLQALVAIKKMRAWQLLSSSSLAPLVALAPLEPFQ